MQTRGLPLHIIAWAAALMPFISIHVSYLISASTGYVEWCVPYWDSCTSISAAGREPPAKLWFKFSMIPAALCTLGLWWCANSWRRQAGPTLYGKTILGMVITGSLAAFFLMQYTVALGEEGEPYRFLRRSGIILSFAFTFIAQLLLTRLIGELARIRENPWLTRWHNRLLKLLMLLLGIGILSVILDAMMAEAYDNFEDAFEWVMALLLNLYFAGLAVIWKRERAALGVILSKT